ncbi:MAG: DUF3616 domain-containing protein [Candidatus Marinimicrobia bacterium]|nr:DUF3616 domain-containing protein [Candidatus Neomarinimicrobiota bacterium]
MNYRPCMTKTTVFAIFIMLVSIWAYASSPEPKVSNDASQEKGAVQSMAETEVKATDNQSSEDLITFKGICDGSAAVKLEDETILVAYDELNTLFAFATSGGMPTYRFDLTKMLNLKTSDEIDIEAATVSGERIWWIGSHSLDKDGKDAPNRRMLFATNVPSPDLSDMKIVAGPLDLTYVLLTSTEVAKVLTVSARQQPPKKGGVSIEGLAESADGGLLVGFRSPLSGANGVTGKALVVNLLPKGDTFEVQSVSLLDLGNRGVRDIVNDGTGYMIVAGPVGSGGKFALYAWNGADPQKQTMSLEGLNAEGILDLGSHWLILSDDGKIKRVDYEADDGDRTCDNIRKKNSKGEAHPNVFFRATMIPK